MVHTKRNIRKRGYHWNLIMVVIKWNKKCKLLLLKCSLMVQTKKKGIKKKWFVTKTCFYGKTKQKMKVGSTKIQCNGSDKKEIRKRGYH